MMQKTPNVCARYVVCVLLLSALLWTAGLATPVGAQTPNRAGLVVDLGNGQVVMTTVSFPETEISGYQLLQRSGLDLAVSSSLGAGVAVCAIEGLGCPASSCFCEMPAYYWGYWYLDNGRWVYAPVGASTSRVRNGDIQGWRWGGGDPPALVTAAEVFEHTDVRISQATTQQQDPYPGPPAPPPVQDPPPPTDPYPIPPAPQTPAESTPVPTSTQTPDTEPTDAAATPATVTATATDDDIVGPSPTRETPIAVSPEPTKTDADAPPQPTEQEPEGVLPGEAAGPPTATPDPAAIVIATGVAQQRETAAAAESQRDSSPRRQYTGFFVLAGLLGAGVAYVALLNRQRRQDAYGADGEQQAGEGPDGHQS